MRLLTKLMKKRKLQKHKLRYLIHLFGVIQRNKVDSNLHTFVIIQASIIVQ